MISTVDAALGSLKISEEMSEADAKPTITDKINAAAQCLDRAAVALRTEGSTFDDVVAHLNLAQEIVCGVAEDNLPQQDLVMEVLKDVFQSIVTTRQAAEKLFAAKRTLSSDSGDVSMRSQPVPVDSPAPDAVRDSVAALRRHVSPDMGMASLAGMAQAKQMLTEAVVLPMRYRHLFTGARKPWQSVLLYGPPGTGKTRLALAVAAEVDAELYAISPADLLSSWFGQTEQNIRELFGQLRARAQSKRVIVFLDEVDGLCRRRTNEEAESTRRMKTELLTQLQEGIGVDGGQGQTQGQGPATQGAVGPGVQRQGHGQLFFVCATNCPWEIDPAFLRRFQRRIFISLPDRECRQEIIRTLTAGGGASGGGPADPGLQAAEWQRLLDSTEGFTGSDLADLVKNALYQPVRELSTATHWVPTSAGMWMPCSINTIGAVRQDLQWFPPDMVCARNVTTQDFYEVIANTRPTVCQEDLARYEQFTCQFGQMG